MLEFERVVKVPDDDVAVYVFSDAEKGHIVYLSHTGAMNVVEKEKNSKVRAAGFMVGADECSGCSGC